MAEICRSRAALLLAVLVALAGCGDKPAPTPEEEVRATLAELGRATAAKDYKALCTKIFAPKLVEQLGRIGLPCELAMRRGLGDVREPRLRVGTVKVTGDQATADVRTSAAGQEPSQDVVELVRIDGSWRVSSLAGAATPPPSNER